MPNIEIWTASDTNLLLVCFPDPRETMGHRRARGEIYSCWPTRVMMIMNGDGELNQLATAGAGVKKVCRKLFVLGIPPYVLQHVVRRYEDPY